MAHPIFPIFFLCWHVKMFHPLHMLNECCLYRIRTIALVLIFAHSYVDKQSEGRYVNIDTLEFLYKVYAQRMYIIPIYRDRKGREAFEYI